MSDPVPYEREIFLEAREIADVKLREHFLSRACGGDATLRREVEELLSAEAAAGQFLPKHAPDTPERASFLRAAEDFSGPTSSGDS